jgi:hypothetical protein
MTDLAIVLPPCSDDKISADLRYLTEVLMDRGEETTGGLLGGEYGYGAEFENDTLMMHPYCWCEQSDCPWCLPCECEYANGWKHPVTRVCRRCAEGLEHAPNFLHKPSGTTVHWYKYIGRSMDVDLREDWLTVMGDCLRSLA